jgi:predicted Zn-dependent protease
MRETARILSSTAFDREQEHEADTSAVRYMVNAGIDPEHLANFLFRLSKEKFDVPKNFEWLSTHPNTGDRSAEILTLRKKETLQVRPLMNQEDWDRYKKFLRSLMKDDEKAGESKQ